MVSCAACCSALAAVDGRADGRCGDLLFLRLAKLVQRFDVLLELGGFGACRVEIVRALRDLLLQIGVLTAQFILRRRLFHTGSGRWTKRAGERPRRIGDLMFHRLAELLQRLDVTPQFLALRAGRIQAGSRELWSMSCERCATCCCSSPDCC